MRKFLALLLSMSLAVPAVVFAKTEDDALMKALRTLNTEVDHLDNSRAGKLKRWGFDVMTYVAYFAGTLAIMNPGVEAQIIAAIKTPPTDPQRLAKIQAEMLARGRGNSTFDYYFSASQRSLFTLSAMVATVGGVMWLVGFVSKWAKRKDAHDPKYYQSAEAMQEFFALSLDKQHELANSDEDFRAFIFQLYDSWLLIEKGHPVFKPHSPAVPQSPPLPEPAPDAEGA